MATRQAQHDETRSEATLRRAQQAAFDKMIAAKDTAEYEGTVSAAVRELIDACEAYITTK